MVWVHCPRWMSVFSWVTEYLEPASAVSHSLEASDPAGRLDHGIHPWCMFKDMSIEHPCFTCVASGLGSPSPGIQVWQQVDRKSTRLNSSHSQISYAVFCLKKKKQRQ